MRYYLTKDGLQTFTVDAAIIYMNLCKNREVLSKQQDIIKLEAVLDHPNIIFKSKITDFKELVFGETYNSNRQIRLDELQDVATKYHEKSIAVLIHDINHGMLKQHAYVECVLFDHTRYNHLIRCALLDEIMPTL